MKSIGLKLWSGMMVLVIIVLILLWLFQIVFLENFYTIMRVSDIKKEAASIAQLLIEGERMGFETKAEAFAYDNNLSIEWMDTKEDILYIAGSTNANGQISMMRNRERTEAFEEALAGKETTISLTHPRFGNKFVLIALPIKKNGEISGVLLVNMPMAPVEDTAAILKKQLLIITVILLAAAVIVSYIISRAFIKPILEIKKVSEKIASGDFSHEVKSGSKDEIGTLAQTINYMGRELSKIEQLRKDLIANVSHELRTPLSLIRGYAETIRDVTGSNPEKREKQLDIVIEESERLSQIVDDMLNLSQLQAGYQQINLKTFLINKTIEAVSERYIILSEKTGIRINIESREEFMVTADEPGIKQVLYNLINNAFNHTKEGGSITIHVINNIDKIKIQVADTGSGIPEDDMRHIWDRYYKSEKTSGRKAVGTGLGLAIVKSILEAHEVQYGVESKMEVGTIFWFELKKQ